MGTGDCAGRRKGAERSSAQQTSAWALPALRVRDRGCRSAAMEATKPIRNREAPLRGRS
jgi:hypothetical protein